MLKLNINFKQSRDANLKTFLTNLFTHVHEQCKEQEYLKARNKKDEKL